MRKWIESLWPSRRTPAEAKNDTLADGLWAAVLQHYPFLARQTPEDLSRLRKLSFQFLKQKEFHGAQGFAITDTIALSIAAQACMVVQHMAPGSQALAWYDDFVGIVVHPSHMLARREVTDDAGVVHQYEEELAGEAMERGPVTLNWLDVAGAGPAARDGTNLVIHEFAHKIDMRTGHADGCPPLPGGFMGTRGDRQARRLWQASMAPAFEAFREQVLRAERFGEPAPWLDAYGASSPAEFFAVACEAYFVNRARFAAGFAALVPLFDACFDRRPLPGLSD